MTLMQLTLSSVLIYRLSGLRKEYEHLLT